MGIKRLLGLSTTAVAGEGWRVVDGATVVVDLAKLPALREPGCAVRLEGGGLERRLLLVHGLDGTFRAYRNNCACGGWRVDPVPGEQKIRCCTPAASTYDYAGIRIAGPAEKNLEVFPVEARGDVVEIKL